MFELLTEALKALAGYPIIQGAVAVMVLLVGVHVMRRGERDRKSNGNGNGNGAVVIPGWIVSGPVHDALSAIHDMNEQSRKQVDLLTRCEAALLACKASLELIRNESNLR